MGMWSSVSWVCFSHLQPRVGRTPPQAWQDETGLKKNHWHAQNNFVSPSVSVGVSLLVLWGVPDDSNCSGDNMKPCKNHHCCPYLNIKIIIRIGIFWDHQRIKFKSVVFRTLHTVIWGDFMFLNSNVHQMAPLPHLSFSCPLVFVAVPWPPCKNDPYSVTIFVCVLLHGGGQFLTWWIELRDTKPHTHTPYTQIMFLGVNQTGVLKHFTGTRIPKCVCQQISSNTALKVNAS